MFRLTIFVLLSTVLVGVFGDRACYLCNSYTDRDQTACVDPMSPYPAVNYTVCADNTVCTRVSYITQKQFIVSRGCDLWGDTCNNIYRQLASYYPDLSSFNCYTCTANYCNSVAGLTMQGALPEVESVEAEVNQIK